MNFNGESGGVRPALDGTSNTSPSPVLGRSAGSNPAAKEATCVSRNQSALSTFQPAMVVGDRRALAPVDDDRTASFINCLAGAFNFRGGKRATAWVCGAVALSLISCVPVTAQINLNKPAAEIPAGYR